MCDTDHPHWLSSTWRLFPFPLFCTGSTRWTLLPLALSDVQFYCASPAMLKSLADQMSAQGLRSCRAIGWKRFLFCGHSDKSTDIMVIKRLTGSGKDWLLFSLSLTPSILFCLISPLPSLIALLSSWFRYTSAIVYTVICTVNGAWRKGRRSETEGAERDRGMSGVCVYTGEKLIRLEL